MDLLIVTVVNLDCKEMRYALNPLAVAYIRAASDAGRSTGKAQAQVVLLSEGSLFVTDDPLDLERRWALATGRQP